IIRFSLAFALPPSGLSASPAPVEGSTRRTVPFSTRGSPAGRRRLWLRSAPPLAVGGVIVPPTPAGGSPHGFFGVAVGLPTVPPNWPYSALLKLAPCPALM